MGRCAPPPIQATKPARPRRARSALSEAIRIDAATKAFRPGLRSRLENFARRSPRHTDLLVAFPAAAVAIATDYGPPAYRGEAMWRARAGAPLADISDALDLPYWMRRLPPDCFDGPLPPLGALRDDDAAFGKRVLPLLPHRPGDRPRWLNAVLMARRDGDDDIAAWTARALQEKPTIDMLLALRLIVLYAWASRYGEGRITAALGRPWSPRQSLLRATEETSRWYRRLIAACRRVDDPVAEAAAEAWRRPCKVRRFEIIPIRSADMLRAEAQMMRNCLWQYLDDVLEARALLFAIHYDGRSLASLELSPSAHSPSQLVVTQLKGVGNCAPPRGARRAVSEWLSAQPAYPWRFASEHAVDAVDQQAWRTVWRRYQTHRASDADVWADATAAPFAWNAPFWAPATARDGLPYLHAADRLIACRRAADA